MTFTEKVLKAIQEASSSSSFYIGCDSSVNRHADGRKFAKYIVVFIVHKDSSRGASILHQEYTLPEFGNLKQRLLNEANFAISLASEIVEHIGSRKLEIHLDINPDPRHKSNVAVKEALAYAKGMGLEAKVKPHSFAAAHAADHFT